MTIHRQLIYQALSSLDLDSKSTKMSYQKLSTLRTLQQLALQLEGSVEKTAYAHYSGEIRAKSGKFAAENGNEKARKHFSKDFPDLKESTIRNFKKKYYALIDQL